MDMHGYTWTVICRSWNVDGDTWHQWTYEQHMLKASAQVST